MDVVSIPPPPPFLLNKGLSASTYEKQTGGCMAKSLFVCSNPLCGKYFERRNAEANRSKKLGRRFFCSLRCYGISQGKNNFDGTDENVIKKNRASIVKYCGNSRDEFTEFRYFMSKIRNRKRRKHCEIRKKPIDLQYLRDLWFSQGGKCPLTGWKLELPSSVSGWSKNETRDKSRRASLDRIDNSLWYERGNVRYISYMANIARGAMSDDELIEFCNSVSSNKKS